MASGAATKAVAAVITLVAVWAGLTVAPTTARAETAASHLVPVTPTRVLDTRLGSGRLAVLRPRAVPLVPPVGAVAVSLNLTAVGAAGPGFVAVHPCDQRPGGTSTLNVTAGNTVANAVPLAPVGAAGLCVSASVAVDVVVDVEGWWLEGPGPVLEARPPRRVLDTRSGGGPRRPGLVPIPLTVDAGTAVAVTVVLTDAVADAWAAVHPCAQAPGSTSSVNAPAGGTAANLAVVGAGGPVCVTPSVAAHVVVDVVAIADGAGEEGHGLAAQPPVRLLDTRTSGPAWVGEGGTVEVSLGTARTAVLNVTAVDPLGAGYLTVWPCAEPAPVASALSWSRPATVATAVVAGAPDGRVCLRPSVGTHVVVDLLGADDASAASATTSVTGRTDTWLLGRSREGRPLTARAVGTWGGPVALAVAGIHGDEPAGIPIVRAVAAKPPAGALVWLVEAANPDGLAAGRRTNAAGVDLNRNFPVGWAPGDGSEGAHGPGPLSEPESQALARLLEITRPGVAVWWHQVGDWVDTGARVARPAVRDRYAELARVGLVTVPCEGGCDGTATQYGNAIVPGATHFVVELPEVVDAAAVARHAAAFAAVAAG